MQAVTITQISPNELAIIIEDAVKRSIREHIQKASPQDADQWFDVPGLCSYLPEKPAKQTLYQWLSDCNSDLPRHKKGKKVYFLKSEIDQWLAQGKRYTRRDAANDANSFLSAKA